MALLKGNSRDIIAVNVKTLKDAGYKEHHATHIAMKHAAKGKSAKGKKPKMQFDKAAPPNQLLKKIAKPSGKVVIADTEAQYFKKR